MVTIYGIKNCNTMQKAFAWFQQNDIPYDFHDYKKSGITLALLESWSKQAPFEKLLNRNGQTWKKQSTEIQKEIIDKDATFNFLLTNTSAIKRPIIEIENHLIIGFEEELLNALLLK
jgi:Spx/MgsR family transcriptional regulator